MRRWVGAKEKRSQWMKGEGLSWGKLTEAPEIKLLQTRRDVITPLNETINIITIDSDSSLNPDVLLSHLLIKLIFSHTHKPYKLGEPLKLT